jgi:hypothetical protein
MSTYYANKQDRDEGSNFAQSYDPELVKEELRPLVFEEVRQQVRLVWNEGGAKLEGGGGFQTVTAVFYCLPPACETTIDTQSSAPTNQPMQPCNQLIN